GIATGKDLALLSGENLSPTASRGMWLLAEIAIIACDLAEVLGGGLAFKLLLGVPLIVGILLTVLDTLIVLGLQGQGFRRLEAIILRLLATSGIWFTGRLALS